MLARNLSTALPTSSLPSAATQNRSPPTSILCFNHLVSRPKPRPEIVCLVRPESDLPCRCHVPGPRRHHGASNALITGFLVFWWRRALPHNLVCSRAVARPVRRRARWGRGWRDRDNIAESRGESETRRDARRNAVIRARHCPILFIMSCSRLTTAFKVLSFISARLHHHYPSTHLSNIVASVGLIRGQVGQLP